MKKILIFSVLIFSLACFKAQVSMITSGFSQNLTKKDLNFSGDRKLYAIGINDKNYENYFVVSKNAYGASSDEMYLEKFTKNGSDFSKTFSYKMEHPINLSLSFVNNRASFADVDKDGNYESISIVDEHQSGPESPVEKVHGIIQYKNNAYVVSVSAEDDFSKNEFSSNFSKLPKEISAHFLKFWNELSKN